MKIFLNNIQALVMKEFLAVLRDAKSRIVLIVPPIIQLLVFGYAVTFDLNHVPFAVLLMKMPARLSRELDFVIFKARLTSGRPRSLPAQDQIAAR